MTRRDVMGHNEGLIDTAMDQLAGRSVHSLDLTGMQRHRKRAPTLALAAQNVERVETTADGRNLSSTPVRAGKATVKLRALVHPGTSSTVKVRFLGYTGLALVAERIVQINLD